MHYTYEMLTKARQEDLLAEAERWRTTQPGAARRRAERLMARAVHLTAWAERLRRRASLLDQTCPRTRSAPFPNLPPPR